MDKHVHVPFDAFISNSLLSLVPNPKCRMNSDLQSKRYLHIRPSLALEVFHE